MNPRTRLMRPLSWTRLLYSAINFLWWRWGDSNPRPRIVASGFPTGFYFLNKNTKEMTVVDDADIEPTDKLLYRQRLCSRSVAYVSNYF